MKANRFACLACITLIIVTFTGRAQECLGQLSANSYAPESTRNPYGPYGSRYAPDSIYNPYAEEGPVIVSP